ncbi:hypothetical protein ON010_g12529 [Phytophthora cinnamomi]|nr:hypothetical protein ON010_g12529 [Phytophthora cinnamomi]
MSAADVEAFSAVLASDHPEELLSGSPRGVVDERDAVLKRGALDSSNSDGLTAFLKVVGHSLLFLTIDGPIENLDANLILQHCPNLVELSLCTLLVDIRLNVVDLRGFSQAVPPLHRYWYSIGDLASAIGDEAHPFSKCVRRVRVRRVDAWSGWAVHLANYYPPIVDGDFSALLEMLKANRSLEYRGPPRYQVLE